MGINLVPALLGVGHEVTLLNRGNVPIKGTTQLIADRENPQQLSQAANAAGNFDVVIDTSAYTRAHTAAARAVFANRTRHWVHLGSAAVYKEKANGHPNEKDSIGGAAIWGEYGIQKSEADQFLIEQSAHIPITILRPPYLYGPHNSDDRETFVWARALQNRPVIVPGDGQTPIQFLHIDDLASAIILALQKRPEGTVVYNVAADERPTLAEWVAIAAEAGGFPDPGILAGAHAKAYRPRQYFPFRDYPCCVETDLIKTALGWRTRYSLAVGLRQTYAAQDVAALRIKRLDTRVEDQILALS